MKATVYGDVNFAIKVYLTRWKTYREFGRGTFEMLMRETSKTQGQQEARCRTRFEGETYRNTTFTEQEER